MTKILLSLLASWLQTSFLELRGTPSIGPMRRPTACHLHLVTGGHIQRQENSSLGFGRNSCPAPSCALARHHTAPNVVRQLCTRLSSTQTSDLCNARVRVLSDCVVANPSSAARRQQARPTAQPSWMASPILLLLSRADAAAPRCLLQTMSVNVIAIHNIGVCATSIRTGSSVPKSTSQSTFKPSDSAVMFTDTHGQCETSKGNASVAIVACKDVKDS